MVASPETTSYASQGLEQSATNSTMASPVEDTHTQDITVVEHRIPDYWEGSRVPVWLQTIVTHAFVFVVVHYVFWFVPVVLAASHLIHSGWTWLVVILAVAYVPSYLDGAQSSAQGKQWEAFRSMRLWNLVGGSYFKMKILREVPAETSERDNGKYVFGYHPHGVFVHSRFALPAGNWETVFPSIDTRILGASAIFTVPFCRDASLWLGAVDASRATADKVLASGKSVKIYPGGIPEMFVSDRDASETVLILKKRLGFIRLAIRNGADLVPVMVFNEKYLYNVWTPPPRLAAMVRKTLRVPLIAFWGRFMWMPLQPPKGKTFGLVFGKPICVVQNASPSEEEVVAVQSLYASELMRLFEQYKGAFGCEQGEKLVIT